jgi:hypothetical protein
LIFALAAAAGKQASVDSEPILLLLPEFFVFLSVVIVGQRQTNLVIAS